MISGFRFVTEDPIDCSASMQISYEEQSLQHVCYSGVGITHIVTSNEETIDKISELIRFKFDHSITSQKVFLIWSTIGIDARASTCDDIDSDCMRFVQLGEHLIKGVV